MGALLAACGDDQSAPPLGQGDAGADGLPPAALCAPRAEAPRVVVTRAGSELRVSERPFRAVGTNLYFLQELATRALRGQTDAAQQLAEVLDEAACRGFTVVRTWGFSDDSRKDAVMRSAPGVYSEAGLRGLDHAIAEAGRRGLRVILPLVNNWDDYGGLGERGYAGWLNAADPNGRPKSHDDFFTDAAMQALWQDAARTLTSRINHETGVRYADDPTIAAWEIGNELRCASCRGTRRLVDTVATLARALKALDPQHLIGDGGEGFDDDPSLYAGLSESYPVRGDEGASFSALAAIPELDLLSYHHYPDRWGLRAPGDTAVWFGAHQAIARAAGKVAYLGEYGLESPGLAAADQTWSLTYASWLQEVLQTQGTAVALHWQVVPTGGPYHDAFAVDRVRHPLTLAVLAWFAGQLAR